MTPTFGIITISYKRDNVLRLWCRSIRRLRQAVGYFPVVVVGDEEHSAVCIENNIHHIPYPNRCMKKWNMAVAYLMSLGVEYVIISGSDDIISTRLLKNLIDAMKTDVDLIGIKTVYFYCGDGKLRGQLRRLDSKQILGVCRTIHSRVIKQVGELWTSDRNWGMDSDNAKNVAPFIKSRVVVEGEVYDIKTSESLNKFTLWYGKLKTAYSPKEFYDSLSEEELTLLKSL